ncbi:hypothetical protein [Flavobacterium macrobrachii]|nr:hypothetical protein [Flavobacterium macrobrachii]
MKQHIKKIQFLVIALFTIMLSSCSDDLYHQGSKPVTKNKTVSIEEFKRNTGLHNFSKTFKIPKDNTIAYRNADGSYELSDFDINFDYIKQVVVENKISYTFNIVPKIVTSKSIFNLVVYNHDGNWETSIIELIPTDENFDKLLAGIDNEFEGSIRQVYASRVQQDCNIIAYNVVRCIDPNSVKCRIECDKCADCLKLIFFAVCNGNDIVQPLYVLPGSSGGGSIGSGSGLSDPSGYIFDPNMYELGSKKYQQAKNAAEFWHGLSVSQQQWATENESNKETYRDIIAYINRPENINNTVVRNFGREILVQMLLNPELKLDINASAKSPAFVDMSSIDASTPEGAKFNLVYEELMKSPKFKELFIDLFQNNDRFNVKFKIGAVPNGANGNTDTDLENPTLNLITISPQYLLSKNKMEIAKTIIHECIHAYLNVKLCDAGQGMSISNLNNMDFYNVVNQQYNGFNGGQNQHNFIYNYMIPTMVTILSEVKDSLVTPADNATMLGLSMHIPHNNSPATPFVWNDYYHNLSLNGLQNCNFFQNEIGIFDNQGNVISIINQTLMQSYNQYNYYGHLYLH